MDVPNPTNPTSTRLYRYQPLQLPRGIRLLRLEPAVVETDPLAGGLVEISLDKSPKYDALSYTWGDASATVKMSSLICEGSGLPITKNCHGALTRLRQPSKPIHVWVDAVCIDQSCVQERNSQVTMMGDIYKSASRVVVWLGPGDDESDYVFQLMKRVSRLLCFALPHQRSSQIDVGKNRKMLKVVADMQRERERGHRNDDLAKVKKSRHRPFLAFQKRPYWTRMWTLQEFAANKNTVLYCGRAEPVSAFFLYAVSSLHFTNDPLLQHSFDTMRKSFRLHHECVYDDKRGQLPLSHLLLEILSMKASEPRDKIYALRSVFEDVFGDIPVDYSAAVSDIYNEATRRVIRHDKSLDILKEAGREGKWNVASWAVDWDSDFSESLSSGIADGCCSLDSGFDAQFSSDSRILSVRGKLFDKIVAVSSGSIYLTRPLGKVSEYQLEAGKTYTWYGPPPQDMEPFFHTVAQFFWDVHASQGRSGLDLPRKMESLLVLLLEAHYRFQNGKIPIKLLEPLSALLLEERSALWPEDLESLTQETVGQLFSVLEDAFPSPFQLGPLSNEFLLFLWRATSKVGMERLFYTEAGRMGVSNARIQVGDVVAGLSGLGNPFALRPSIVPDRFNLVGQAILTGVMDGEEWSRGKDGLSLLRLV